MAYSSNCLNNFSLYDSDQFSLPVFITDTEGVAEKVFTPSSPFPSPNHQQPLYHSKFYLAYILIWLYLKVTWASFVQL